MIAGPPPLQNLIELDELLQLVEQLQPQRSLEIGVHLGGTAYQWAARTSDLLYLIDLEHKGYPYSWPGCRAVFIDYGPSQSPACVDRAREWAPYDFIFVDGDHHYDKVRADVENFWPLLRDGGIMALHDINVGRSDVPPNIHRLTGEAVADDMPDAGPRRLWAELDRDVPVRGLPLYSACRAIIGPRDTNPLGIGVMWK